ncbi:hypothetical protein WA588_004277 [Blastocystis sp. NMH]
MDKKKLGYYAGYIMSSFYLGQLPGCLFWGWIADRYGRRKPLLVVVLLDSLFVFVFAFIRNYYVAVVLRFVWGFCDGHYALIKTLVADYSDSRTIARNSSFLFLSVSIGNSISPLLGGYLSNPHNLSPWLLNHFPILLKKQFCFPFIVCGSLLALCFIAVYLWVVETPRKDALLPEEEKPKQSYTSLLCDKNVLITILLYGIEALCQVSYDSLTSLWLSSSRADGGMNWSVMDIGWFMCFVCPMQMGNLVVFPIMSQALSVTVTYTTISSLQAILLFLTPFVTLLPNQICLIVFLYIATSFFHLFRTILFKYPLTRRHESFTSFRAQENRAKSYGLSQMLGGMGRFIGPPTLTSLFAWSISSSHPYPFNYALSYCILSFLSLVAVLASLGLSKSVNTSRV